jgi:hypothetical protein
VTHHHLHGKKISKKILSSTDSPSSSWKKNFQKKFYLRVTHHHLHGKKISKKILSSTDSPSSSCKKKNFKKKLSSADSPSSSCKKNYLRVTPSDASAPPLPAHSPTLREIRSVPWFLNCAPAPVGDELPTRTAA